MKTIYARIDDLQKQIDAQRPLSPHLLKQIKEYYRIGLTYTSNALEGNSLTESETKIVLEEGITIGGKRIAEHLEAIGHSDAYEHLYALVRTKDITITDLKRLHHLFYFRIDEHHAGVYRSERAIITGSQYALPHPDALDTLMEQCMANIRALRAEKHPVHAAALAHKEFVFIHPFVDGNGRVARLLMNLILLQEGYEIALIPPIIRSAYISALEKAHTDDSDFCQLIARMVYETQQDYVRLFLS